MLPEPLNTIRKRPVLSLYVTGAVLLAVGAWVWWAQLSLSPQRTFWGMISQSMATSGVTIQAQQSGNGTTLRQTVQYSTGVRAMSHSITVLSQRGTTVVDELAGTPKTDYTRYASIKTDQKGTGGKPLDFSPVLGVWATGASAQAQLFGQAVLGTGLPIGGVAVPIANFPAAQRAKLLKEIKDDAVYQVSYGTVKKQRSGGRLQYVYTVQIQPVAYAAMMQHFAQAVGLHELDNLDPAAFKGQPALKLHLTVDARARHLVAAEAANGSGRQTYTSYDVPVQFTPPAHPLTVQQLQQRLSAIR